MKIIINEYDDTDFIKLNQLIIKLAINAKKICDEDLITVNKYAKNLSYWLEKEIEIRLLSK